MCALHGGSGMGIGSGGVSCPQCGAEVGVAHEEKGGDGLEGVSRPNMRSGAPLTVKGSDSSQRAFECAVRVVCISFSGSSSLPSRYFRGEKFDFS